MRLGVLAADDLTRVLATVASNDDRELAHALLALGTIARVTILAEYHTQVEEAVYHLFGWTHGTFTFEPDDHPIEERRCFQSVPTRCCWKARGVWTNGR